MMNEEFNPEMAIWDDFIKREELEVSPGVIDENLVQALTLNTYLAHIREMLRDGMTEFPEAVSDHIEEAMVSIFISYTHTFENRYPEVEEINAHLALPENAEMRKSLTALAVNSDPDNWPEVEKQLKDMLSKADLTRINWNSRERRECVEKRQQRFDEDGFIEL